MMIARACVAVGMVTLMVFLIVILVSLLKKETDHPGGAVDIEQTDVSEPESTVPSSDPEQIPSTEESESSEPEASTSEDTPTTSESGVSDIQQSTVGKVNGKWNLEELDNTPRNFGYSDSNRAENMVPKDWAFYEKRWGLDSGYKLQHHLSDHGCGVCKRLYRRNSGYPEGKECKSSVLHYKNVL